MSARAERVEPGAGQEEVWGYPPTPGVEGGDEHVEVGLGGGVLADPRAALPILETSPPPTYYLPFADFRPGSLRPAQGSSFCEWKGVASYVDLLGGDAVAPRAGWFYPAPTAAYAGLRDHVALYPGAVDRCTVDGEAVRPQPGDFYGGWVTDRVVGPFKGEPGTRFW